MNTHTTNSLAESHFRKALGIYLDARMKLAAETRDEDEIIDRLTDEMSAAENYVLDHAAPDLAGVIAKIEIAGADAQPLEADTVSEILCDLMRLANLRGSPTFQPAEWLVRFKRSGGHVTLTKRNDEEPTPLIGAPINNSRAGNMIRRLKQWERQALHEHLATNLDPRAYGLEA